eukprot:1874457-Pyramimonas_sp.AAC.1
MSSVISKNDFMLTMLTRISAIAVSLRRTDAPSGVQPPWDARVVQTLRARGTAVFASGETLHRTKQERPPA